MEKYLFKIYRSAIPSVLTIFKHAVAGFSLKKIAGLGSSLLPFFGIGQLLPGMNDFRGGGKGLFRGIGFLLHGAKQLFQGRIVLLQGVIQLFPEINCPLPGIKHLLSGVNVPLRGVKLLFTERKVSFHEPAQNFRGVLFAGLAGLTLPLDFFSD